MYFLGIYIVIFMVATSYNRYFVDSESQNTRLKVITNRLSPFVLAERIC